MDREMDQRLKIIFKIFLCNEDEGISNRFQALREVTQLVPLKVSYEFINLSYTYVWEARRRVSDVENYFLAVDNEKS